MVMLQRWKSLMEGEWFPYRGGLFNGAGLVVTLMEGEWTCYRSGHFNGGKMVMLLRWTV